MVHKQLKKYSNLFRNFICSIGFIFHCFSRIKMDYIEIGRIEGLKKDHVRVFSFFSKFMVLRPFMESFMLLPQSAVVRWF